MESEVKQVGGDHYESEFQHWDWVEDSGMGYLEGCATKYVTRWRDKGTGKEDLEKARSYVTKVLQKFQTQGRRNSEQFGRFCVVNMISDPLEIGVCLLLGGWVDANQLYTARDMITEIIAKNFPSQSTVSTENPFSFSDLPPPSLDVLDTTADPDPLV